MEVNDSEPPMDPIGTQLSNSSSPKPDTMVDVFMSPGGSATEMLSSKSAAAAEENGGLRESNRARILSTIIEEKEHFDHKSVDNMNSNPIPLLNNPSSNAISEQSIKTKPKMVFGTSLSKNGGSAPNTAAIATLSTHQRTTAESTPITTQPLASTLVSTPAAKRDSTPAAKRDYANIATPSPVSGAGSPSSANRTGSITPPVRHELKAARK